MPIEPREINLADQSDTLSVREKLRQFYGAWFCAPCNLGGVIYELVPSIEEAFALAQSCALKHQEEKHRLDSLNSL